MQQVVTGIRRRGALVVHAPSDARDFAELYEGTPARRRVLNCPRVAPPPNLEHDDPPLPVDQIDTVPDEQHPYPVPVAEGAAAPAGDAPAPGDRDRPRP